MGLSTYDAAPSDITVVSDLGLTTQPMTDGAGPTEPNASARRDGLIAAVMGIAVFMGGAVTLGMEIAASRVVAPYFGTSLFVWGALIGVVLTGLSIGYWIGGLLADRWPTPGLLVSVMIVGAALVLAIPLVDKAVLSWIVRWDPGPKLDPVIAAVVLFGPASLVLACVSPIAVRLFARTVARLGRTAGRLFSVSTAGSIAGTFVTAFWLVPNYGTRQLLAVGAASLFVAAALLAAVVGNKGLTASALVLTVVALIAAGQLAPTVGGTLSAEESRNYSPVFRRQNERANKPRADHTGLTVKFEKDTRYHRVAVTDDADTRYLRFDSSFQSGMSLSDPFASTFMVHDFFSLARAYKPDAKSVLFLGLGGGSSVKRMWRDFPDMTIDSVEIDPVVIDVAKRFFQVPEDPRLTFTAGDARQYLQKSTRTWDVIAIDIYYSDGLPFHVTTEEFFKLVREHLNPGGLVLMNTIGFISGADSQLFRAIVRTQQGIFNAVHVHPVLEAPDDTVEGLLNIFIISTIGKSPSKEALRKTWLDVAAKHPTVPDLVRAIETRYDQSVDIHDVPVLTDDFAPTDALLLGSSPGG